MLKNTIRNIKQFFFIDKKQDENNFDEKLNYYGDKA